MITGIITCTCASTYIVQWITGIVSTTHVATEISRRKRVLEPKAGTQLPHLLCWQWVSGVVDMCGLQ